MGSEIASEAILGQMQSRSNSKSYMARRVLYPIFMYSQKFDTILGEPYSFYCYYGSASVPKWPQKQSQSI